jgi:large subunit ribosomal protein L32
MAHPKRKISRTRRDKRRTHYKLGKKQLIVDKATGEVSEYHRLNLETGYYKGIKVLDVNPDA